MKNIETTDNKVIPGVIEIAFQHYEIGGSLCLVQLDTGEIITISVENIKCVFA